MKVTEVFALAPELIGQVITVEGVLARRKWKRGDNIKIDHPWYMASPEMVQDENFSQAIRIDKIPRHAHIEKPPLNQMRKQKLDAFFQGVSSNQFPGLSEPQARLYWDRLYLGAGSEEDIEAFIRANALNDLIEALSFSREELGKEPIEWNFDLLKPSTASSDDYDVYPGYIIGTLTASPSNASNLSLKNNAKAVVEDKRGTLYLGQEALDFSEIPLGLNEITPASQIIQQPEMYADKILRVDGVMSHHFAGDWIIFPHFLYTSVDKNKSLSIQIVDEKFAKQVYDTSRMSIDLEPKRQEHVQIVGKLHPHSTPITITEISAAASKFRFNSIYHWKL